MELFGVPHLIHRATSKCHAAYTQEHWDVLNISSNSSDVALQKAPQTHVLLPRHRIDFPRTFISLSALSGIGGEPSYAMLCVGNG